MRGHQSTSSAHCVAARNVSSLEHGSDAGRHGFIIRLLRWRSCFVLTLTLTHNIGVQRWSMDSCDMRPFDTFKSVMFEEKCSGGRVICWRIIFPLWPRVHYTNGIVSYLFNSCRKNIANASPFVFCVIDHLFVCFTISTNRTIRLLRMLL